MPQFGVNVKAFANKFARHIDLNLKFNYEQLKLVIHRTRINKKSKFYNLLLSVLIDLISRILILTNFLCKISNPKMRIQKAHHSERLFRMSSFSRNNVLLFVKKSKRIFRSFYYMILISRVKLAEIAAPAPDTHDKFPMRFGVRLCRKESITVYCI